MLGMPKEMFLEYKSTVFSYMNNLSKGNGKFEAKSNLIKLNVQYTVNLTLYSKRYLNGWQLAKMKKSIPDMSLP